MKKSFVVRFFRSADSLVQSLPVLEESRIEEERNRVSRVSSRATGIRTWKEVAREVKLVVNEEFLILRLQWRAKSQGAAEVKQRSNEGHWSSHGTSVLR